MAKRNKYTYLWVLQGDYGYGHGWEDLTASEDFREVYADKQAYRDNEGGRYRIIQRREPNEPAPGRVQGRGTVTQPE